MTWGFFRKNPALSHTTLYEPLTQEFKKKKQSRENLWTDGRTDGQALFYRTLPAETGGPIKDGTLIKSIKSAKVSLIKSVNKVY